jgi:hypothetical protein
MFVYILVFSFLERRWKTKDFEENGSKYSRIEAAVGIFFFFREYNLNLLLSFLSTLTLSHFQRIY